MSPDEDDEQMAVQNQLFIGQCTTLTKFALALL